MHQHLIVNASESCEHPKTGPWFAHQHKHEPVRWARAPPPEKPVLVLGQPSLSAGNALEEAEINSLVGAGKETIVDNILKDSVQSSFAILAEVNPEEDEMGQEEAVVSENPNVNNDLQIVTTAEKLSHSL
ncbi:hypothetical protein U1Q18_040736 [Sarracenia purpurea var. burkii]